MRLLLITNDFPPRAGGIQQYLGNLVGAHGGEVMVLAPADRVDGDIERAGVVVRRHRRRFMWPTPGVRRWIEREAKLFSPDAVLFGAPYPLAWHASRLRRVLGVHVAILCHGAEITAPALLPIARQLVRRSLRGADVLLAVSRFTARRVERLTDRPAVYIGSGVDADLFSPAHDALEAGDQGDNLPIVGCVSRFVPRKGQHRLIRAAAILRKRGTPVQLLLVGAGRRLAALQRLAARRRVPTRFEVGVDWSALPDFYREMDVFCMPCRSRWGGLEAEGLGIVYLEAGAAGLPVLAGDSGGAPETVIRGETGFVVHNVGDIVEALEMLIGDPGRASAMGTAGRDFIATEYTWDAASRRLHAALSGVD